MTRISSEAASWQEQLNLDVDRYNQLLDAVYGGPTEDSPWQTFLEQFRDLTEAQLVTLVRRIPSPGDDGLIFTLGGDDQLTEAYRQHLPEAPQDLAPNRQVVTLGELLPEESLQESAFYQRCMAPLNLAHMVSVDIHQGGLLHCRLTAARTKTAGDFNQAHKELCQRLIPHLERSMLQHKALCRSDALSALYAEALAKLSLGIILLNRKGVVLDTNEKAQQLLKKLDGLSIAEQRLIFNQQKHNRKLRHAVEASSHHNADLQISEVLQLPNREGGLGFGVLIKTIQSSPLTANQQFLNGYPGIAVFIWDQDHSLSETDLLQQLYGFTPTEANVALLLATGRTADETSETLGISKNTVKTHMKSIFLKAGVNRQTELVNLLNKSVALLA